MVANKQTICANFSYYSISAFPNIDPIAYFNRKKINDPILSQKNFFFYSSGRAALFHAIQSSGLPKRCKVLCPSFHCGVEVEAILRAGYHVEFYNIKRDLHIDFEDLEHHTNKITKALIVIHYFGFPQNMDKVLAFCNKHNLMLFEDCAHALYSSYNNKFLGDFGTFGVFSMRKTIALPNGGGIQCNSRTLPAPLAGRNNFNFHVVKTTIKSIIEYKVKTKSILGIIFQILLSLKKTMLGDNARNLPVPKNNLPWFYEVPGIDYHGTISWLSIPLLFNKSYVYVLRKRQYNYKIMNKYLNCVPDSVKFANDIDDSVCPLCFVVIVENRGSILEEMRSNGVNPFVFGAISHPSLSKTNFHDIDYLTNQLMGLPIHQQLSEQDIKTVAQVFINALKNAHLQEDQ